ncbi:hypothetical protein GALMADRAFT_55853 [Galerina marginata CBS 339.88]|uniref:Cytochrome P450 n=1 Tax=Galerina marginata (strain CBS 339.88) TaxID=685588 RepID=A0A067TK95_GALM3|nr:hypothetical protein GALMADRAFT_55853 [Galerina marginata CBS 339.88]
MNILISDTVHAIIFLPYVILISGLLAVVQRLFFHPLSSFPGPRLAAASSLYKTYYEVMKGGELLERIHHLHSIHGPVIRIGPNELHFADYRAYSEIYSVGSHLTKDPQFYSCFGASGSAFGAIDPRTSKMRRGFMHAFFSRRAVIRLEDVIQQKVERLVSKLEKSYTPQNAFLAFRSATLDIITSYMFGHCLDALDYPDFRSPLLLNIQLALPLLWVIKSFPCFIPVLAILPSWTGRRLHEQFKALLFIREFLLSWLGRTAKEAEMYPDSHDYTICHHLFYASAKASDAFPSLQSVVHEALSLLQAGSDTVGNTCTVGTFYVLNDKVVYARLVEELRSNWPDKDQPIELSILQNLPYLTAVIKEALRLSHGFVTPLPRVVGPAGARIIGRYIPPNTVVGMSVTYVHLNSALFPDPTLFTPERWLQPSSHKLSRYLVPFSAGPRMCLGVSMAWAELYLFFGYMFRKLDIQIVDTEYVNFSCVEAPRFIVCHSIGDFCTFKDYFVPVHEGRHLHIQNVDQCIAISSTSS